MDICYSLTYFGKILVGIGIVVFLIKIMEDYINAI